MFHHYDDILSRIAEPPTWFDEQGSPARIGRGTKIADLIRAGELDCGDPPNVGCCSDGSSMGAITRRVIQYRSRYRDSYRDGDSPVRFVRGSFAWQRDRSLELPIKLPDEA